MNPRSGASGAHPHPNQPLRTMNMSSYGAQPSRQTPRLQNTQKSALGNGGGLGGGWGMGLHGGGFGGGIGGGAPGLSAQGRPAQLSGFAQVMGGGSQSAIDMSDFPSLGGGSRQQTAGNWNATSLRQPPQQGLPQQASSQQPQQQQRAPSAAPSQLSFDQLSQTAADRSAGGDEFPPLNNALNGEPLGHSSTFGTSLSSPDAAPSRPNGTQQQSQIPIREPSGSFPQNPHAAIGTEQSHPQSQQSTSQQPNGAAVPNVKRYADMTEQEKWGLPGLAAIFEARRVIEAGGHPDDTIPPDQLGAFMMGQDLHTLGMDLDSTEPLYPTFTPFPATNGSGSQFDFHDRYVIPDFTLPAAYTVTNVPPLSSRVNAFSDETLFTIFYQNPRDVNQELVAMELTARDWRYHKVLRQWLQKDSREAASGSLSVVDLAPNAPVGAPSVRTGDRTERGVYIFFDQNNWRKERREFILDFDQLDNRHNSQALAGAAAAIGAAPGMSLGSSPLAGGPNAVVGGGQQAIGSGGQL